MTPDDPDEPLLAWRPPAEAPDAETNIAKWALENSCGSASAMAAFYVAMSLPNWGAVPFGEIDCALDETRRRWLLAGLAQKVEGCWTAEYMVDIEAIYPEISKAARLASEIYHKVSRE